MMMIMVMTAIEPSKTGIDNESEPELNHHEPWRRRRRQQPDSTDELPPPNDEPPNDESTPTPTPTTPTHPNHPQTRTMGPILPITPYASPDETDPSDGDDGTDDATASNLVNMYFLILAAFAILLLFGAWYWRLGRRRKAVRAARHGRSALAHDMEMARMRGGWLQGRREEEQQQMEGVDERGEPPPPYRLPLGEGEERVMEVRMPVQGGVERPVGAHVREPRLPKYEEVPGRAGQGQGQGQRQGQGSVEG